MFNIIIIALLSLCNRYPASGVGDQGGHGLFIFKDNGYLLIGRCNKPNENEFLHNN